MWKSGCPDCFYGRYLYMSGGTKQQFKQFSITCAEDACLVLGMLISGISVNLEKYKEYASEAESLLESIQEEFVPAKEYSFDRSNAIQTELFADITNIGIYCTVDHITIVSPHIVQDLIARQD